MTRYAVRNRTVPDSAELYRTELYRAELYRTKPGRDPMDQMDQRVVTPTAFSVVHSKGEWAAE